MDVLTCGKMQKKIVLFGMTSSVNMVAQRAKLSKEERRKRMCRRANGIFWGGGGGYGGCP